MSYLHCATCRRAFDAAARAACPACGWRPGGHAPVEARIRDALATIEAALTAAPAREQASLAALVRDRLAGLLAEPVETALVGGPAGRAELAAAHDDPRLRTLVAAIVIALAARFSQAAAAAPRAQAAGRRGLGLARRVWSRFA